MGTPLLESMMLAPSRLGALPRLALIAGVLIIETLFLSSLIQDAPLDALTGIAGAVHTFQHWLFRYLIAYAVSFAMLLYLRGIGFAAIAANLGGARVRYGWVLAHALLLIPMSFLSAALYRKVGDNFLWLAAGWHACGAAMVLCLLAAMAPARNWVAALREAGRLPWFAMLPAAGALLAFKASQLLWAPAAAATFQLVQLLLRPVYPALQIDPASFTLITEHFAVRVSEVCSGLEGVGLMLAFCAAWLWYFRREFFFPRALIIVPAAVVLIFILNAVRIAALVLIGEAGYQKVASVGFHSQAGWIAFNVAAFGVAIVARRSPWLNRTAREIPAAAGPDATPAYLIPLLAILAAGMIAHAMSAGFDLLYPMRLLAAAAALWFFRRAYRNLDWSFSWRGVSAGVAIFALWVLVAHYLSPPRGMPEDLTLLPAPLRSGWIVCRALAAIVTVPIAEELAYRGYLLRRIGSVEFDTASFQRVRWPALAVSSIAFGLTHGNMWLPGILAGLTYGALAVRTGKIGESIAAHATTNSLIAATVLLDGQWQLW